MTHYWCTVEGRNDDGQRMGTRSLEVCARTKLQAQLKAEEQCKADRSDWDWVCLSAEWSWAPDSHMDRGAADG